MPSSPPSDTASRPRRAPRQSRSRATVEAIHGAVLRILGSEGEAALTTNRIADVAGISVGSLYQYFPDRESIIRSMIDTGRELAMQRIREALQAAVARGEAVPALVRTFVRLYLAEFGGSDPARQRLHAFAWRSADPRGIEAGTRAAAEDIGILLQSLSPPGAAPLSPSRLFVLTRAFLGVVRAVATEGSVLAGSALLEDELVGLCLAMLPADGPPRHGR